MHVGGSPAQNCSLPWPLALALAAACLSATAGAAAAPPTPEVQTRALRREPAPAPGKAAPRKPTESPATAPDEARGWETPPPDYQPEDVGLFVPRAILFIPRYVLKAVFWPIQQGLRFVERNQIIEHTVDLLYNDERTAAILPTLSYQSSLGLTAGFTAFHRDLGGFGEKLALDARFGGQYSQFYQLAFVGERVSGSRLWLEHLVRLEQSPQLLFHGFGDPPEAGFGTNLGPRQRAVETRFRQTRMLWLSRVGYTMGRPGGTTKLGVTGILNRRSFGAGEGLADDELSIEEVYDTSQLAGFDEGSRTFELDGNIVIDTRDRQGSTASGIYLAAFGGGVLPVNRYRFVHGGFELTTYINLYRRTRVLALRLASEAVAGKNEEIPFAELPRLGGPNRLRGYTLDRFRDRKTAVGTVEYHYPIHENVGGSVFFDTGRAARNYDELFRLGEFRWGAGGGFTLRTKDSILFTLDVAYGDGVNVYFTTDPLRAFAERSEQL